MMSGIGIGIGIFVSWLVDERRSAASALSSSKLKRQRLDVGVRVHVDVQRRLRDADP